MIRFKHSLLVLPLLALLSACGDDDQPMPYVAAMVSCQPGPSKCPDGSDAVPTPATPGAVAGASSSCPYQCHLNPQMFCPQMARVCANGQPAQPVTGGLGGCVLQCPEDPGYPGSATATTTTTSTSTATTTALRI
jgi:hypothetical protein